MIRRFLTRILLVLLIACCGYNWLQVRRLQAQVRALDTLLAVRTPPADTDWPAPQTLHEMELRTKSLRDQADALWRKANAETRHHKQGTLP